MVRRVGIRRFAVEYLKEVDLAGWRGEHSVELVEFEAVELIGGLGGSVMKGHLIHEPKGGE